MRRGLAALLGALLLILAPLPGGVGAPAGAHAATRAAAATDHAAADRPARRLHLVTLTGPGTAGRPVAERAAARRDTRRELDRLLALVGAGEPAYRWSTALAGMAVALDTEQARRLAGQPRVALVEADRVRPLAAAAGPSTADRLAAAAGGRPGPRHGGRGTVIGVVDSGLAPEAASFASLPSQGPPPRTGTTACPASPDWPRGSCGGKVVAARWFVEGFGRDALSSGASLSPLDDQGHGTQVAAVAAGNAGVGVRVRGRRLGTIGGRSPDARLAVYKACWTAPDPDDDGCTSADLVAAIDRAVADDVDVLNLSSAGSSGLDTVERALLGAAEADVVVLAAAGNDRGGSWAAHPSPWVTTLGGTEGPRSRGTVSLGGSGPVLSGASATVRTVTGRLVGAAAVRRDGASPARARVCESGTLDATRVAGRVVVCERGAVGRVDKSATVALANGAGMVLLDAAGAATSADFHAVPTVHLAAGPGRRLRAWLRTNRDATATLAPAPAGRGRGLAPFTPPGDPTGAVLKPDLVAPATGLVAPVASAGSTDAPRWAVGSGTSLATAWASGAAATVRAAHPGWPAVRVRSALSTGARAVRGDATGLRSGAGRLEAAEAARARLELPETPAGYRAWLEGRRRDLNTTTVLLSGGRTTATRTLRSTASSARYFSSSARGFRGRVRVTPAAVRLAPGEEATFRIAAGPSTRRRGSDAGVVLWRGGDGSRARVPVVLTR